MKKYFMDMQNNNNIFYNNNFGYIENNTINQIYFLQKKRFLENPNIINNTPIFLQDNCNNFFFSRYNNFQLNQFQFAFYSQFINNPYSYCNHFRQLELNNYLSQNLVLKDKETNLEKPFINNNIYNVYDNHINFNHYIKESIINYNNYNIDNNNVNIKYNITNSGCLQDKTINKKKIFFKVIHENERRKKRVIKKYIKHNEKNNEIKVLKNNKVVYVNTSLLNSYSTAKNIKQFHKIIFIGRKKRSSKYRGVNKNCNYWQVLMMLNKKKQYIGIDPTEELAARIYDILALKYRNYRAKTNFAYTSIQIKNIREMDIDIKSKGIYDIWKK